MLSKKDCSLRIDGNLANDTRINNTFQQWLITIDNITRAE